MSDREEIDALRDLVKKHSEDIEKLSRFLMLHFKRDIADIHEKRPEEDSPCVFAIEILKKLIL